MTLATMTSDLADSKPVWVASARSVREYRGVMAQTAETHTLDPNTGEDWKEITLSKLTAMNVEETTDLSTNPQRFSDTADTITPTLFGVSTLVTSRTTRKISRLTVMEMGALAQNSMVRKSDIAGIAVMDGFSNTGPGAGVTLSFSYLSHMATNVRSNTTEPAPEGAPVYIVLHGFAIEDLRDELTGSIGTYELTSGISAEVFRNNAVGMINNAMVLRDDNITIDSASDQKGGVYSQAGLLHIRGTSPYVLTEEKPGLGGGSVAMYHYDEEAWGERLSEGTSVWGREVYCDATAPAES